MGLNVLPPSLAASLPSHDAASSFVGKLQSRLVAKPKGVVGIGGFVFDYAGEDRVERHAEITDHYTEDNTVINDHMALKPTRVVMRGLVSELNQTAKQAAGIFGGLQSLLTTVPAYLGKKTPGALAKIQGAITKAQNIEAQVNQAISQGKSILGLFTKSAPTQTRQQLAFAQLEALQESRQLFSVVTPYRVFDNMVIESVVFVQPESTRFQSDVVVTLKEVRFALTIATPNYLSKFGGRAAFQNQGQSNVGKTPGHEGAQQPGLRHVQGGDAVIQVTNLSDAARQLSTIILADKSTVQLELTFRPAIQRWSLDVTRGAFVARGINMCLHPNLLRSWRKVVPFGLAVVAPDGADPFSIDDFLTGRVTIYVLDSTDGNTDVQDCEAEVYPPL
jgi:hypothetical protein